MPIVQLTTQEQVDQNIANLESRLNQTTPAADKAYNRVIATMEAQGQTALAKYAADRILAVLAQTAKGADLDLLGGEYDTLRHQATAAVLSVTLTGTNATVIPVGTIMVGLPNSALYTVTTGGTIALGTVTLALTAQAAGSSGNLNNADTLTLQSAIAGASGIPTVASTTTTGADVETDDAYRPRVLDAQRAQATGSNAASYRLWAQGVSGVVRAYPYSGAPTGVNPSEPPMRTVYVECDTSIQADGIAPGGLITQVRTAITTDPNTGLARQDLGLTDGTLYVQAITRTAIYVQITGLNVPSGQIAACQTAIAAALTTYLLAVTPFVTGVDPTFGRNDSITNLSISKVVQAVLIAYGAAASNIGFGLTAITFSSTYTVGQGEKTKLGAVSYV
jgi:hypothetical protein